MLADDRCPACLLSLLPLAYVDPCGPVGQIYRRSRCRWWRPAQRPSGPAARRDTVPRGCSKVVAGRHLNPVRVDPRPSTRASLANHIHSLRTRSSRLPGNTSGLTSFVKVYEKAPQVFKFTSIYRKNCTSFSKLVSMNRASAWLRFCSRKFTTPRKALKNILEVTSRFLFCESSSGGMVPD